jgi:uncharacterized membrane protein
VDRRRLLGNGGPFAVKAHLLEYWDRLRSGFWFVPGIMTGAAILFAFATVALDESVTVTGWMVEQSWAYTGGAEGASLVLSTIAGSMITIAGVVFSMTLVALSLASSQLGPRLLRNFMRDTRNQVVLGAFVATFLYCVLVLRTIRRAEEVVFVPHLSVTVGVLLAIVSLGVLIYFIHHVSISIQADEVVARVSNELIDGIDRLFPEKMGHGAPHPADVLAGAGLPAAFDLEARPVGSAEDGYLQSIDPDALMALAKDENAIFRLERRPGQYVVMGCPLVTVWPGDRLTETLEERINSAFILGHQRTAAQDIEFPIHQLVEIAVRALSPGINDPFTATTCVDRLGSALHRLAQREMPSPFRLDEQDRLRVVAPRVSFPEIVNTSFGPIRQYARSSAVVTIRLLETIAVIAGATHRPADRDALLRQAEMIVRGAREALPEDGDRQAAEECYRNASHALSRATAHGQGRAI